MATIKSCTSLEQSRKLAEILPLESADMHYHYDNDLGELESIPTITEEDDHFVLFPKDIRCWSLAALVSVLPILERKGYQKDKPRLLYNVTINKWIVDSHVYTTDAYDNLIEACYEMILKLHELNLL